MSDVPHASHPVLRMPRRSSSMVRPSFLSGDNPDERPVVAQRSTGRSAARSVGHDAEPALAATSPAQLLLDDVSMEEELTSWTRLDAMAAALAVADDTTAGELWPFLDRLVRPLLVRIAARRLEEEVAEDLVQDVMLLAWRFRARFLPGERYFPWVRTIVVRQVVERTRRKRGAREETISEGEWEDATQHLCEVDVDGAIAARLDREDQLRALRETMATLSPLTQRALIGWSHDEPYEQIACATGTPTGTLRSTVSRGLGALRQQMVVPIG